MQTDPIHPETTIDRVYLNVSSLQRSVEFYRGLGLVVISQQGNNALLGTEKHPFLAITEQAGQPRNPRETGLYHFAILLPSREALARTLRHLVEIQTAFDGFSDHLVSEAIYLADPDANGIEIYRDRPRSEWTFEPDGEIRMATEPLDFKKLMSELGNNRAIWDGLPPETRLGHIHLQVSNLRDAEDFYSKALGFEVTAKNYPGALFFAAGGYHHHIGVNIWNSANGFAPPPNSLGLGHYIIQLPNDAELTKTRERLVHAGIEIQETREGVYVDDPSRNRILLATPERLEVPTVRQTLSQPIKSNR